MRGLSFSLVCLFTSLSLFSQNYTWVRGDNFNGVGTGTYGALGVPSTTNEPGHRHGCGHWTDAAGNLWLFGGEGFSTSTTTSWLGDMWRYNPTTNEWTWMKGSSGPNSLPVYGAQNVAASTNDPGAREFVTSWTDNNGIFWLFGGANNAGSGVFADLWKYNPSSNLWTWVSGSTAQDVNGIYGTPGVASSTAMPGSRYAAASWVDASNNLWMFGGRGFAGTGGFGFLNDLWKFNTTTNQWTWMGGSQLSNQNGTYGTQGTPSTANIPGAVEFPASWVGNNGQFYLYSGRGYVGSGGPGYTTDMWRYNPATGEWTWLKGPNLTNQLSNYGTQGQASSTTHPGGRYSTASWKDPEGNFWVFGGTGFATSSIGSLNDLYKYNPTTNQFTWMKGAITPLSNGIYGTMGVPNPSNTPGTRFFNTYWTVGRTLWLFGGEGFDIANNQNENMNDLWKFDAPCNPDSVLASPGTNICSGTAVNLTAYNQYPASVQWHTSPTGATAIGSGSTISIPSLTAASGSSVYTYYSSANSCTFAPRTAISITVNAPPQVSITGNTAVCAGNQVTLVATGAQNYTWASGAPSATLVASPGTATTYSVTGFNIPGCGTNATFQVLVNPLPTLSVSATKTLVCRDHNESTVLSASGALTYTWSTNTFSNAVSVTPTLSTTNYSVTGTDANGCKSSSSITIAAIGCDGLNENNRNSTLVVFPNPSSGEFTIESSGYVDAELKVTNMLGQVIYNMPVSGSRVHFDQKLAKGIYQITIEKNNVPIGVAKLIVE